MSNHYTFSLVLNFKEGLDPNDEATLKYLFMRSDPVPKSWPKHYFFQDTPTPILPGYESFAHGEFLCEMWCYDEGSPAGMHLRIPSLSDDAFFNYLMLADLLATLSLPVGFVGTGTNEFRSSQTMLLYVLNGTLYVNDFQPKQIKGFTSGESIAVED